MSTRTLTGRPPVAAARRPARQSLLGSLAALGCLGEAAAHLPVIRPHLAEAPYIGIGFVLLAIAGPCLAARLVLAPDELTWAATGLVGVIAVLGYVLSRTVGLPQIGDDVGAWWDPLGVVAVSWELVMVLSAVVHFGSSGGHRAES